MENKLTQKQKKSISVAGLLVTLGVVYGDIGTSPLYVMKALIEGNGGLASVTNEFIYGALSLVNWTLTLLTSIKYVLIALRADNHGEGGIFSLYALIRKKAGWLIIPAIIGGAALLADGILTPAVTVTTAVEGLRTLPSYVSIFGTGQGTVILITLVIITL
ncbi:MAG: KUP/HAK/KT family potassium transporter, partial [Carnobacterium jeotgali]|uniref:KUP/HAK/KT family potassium transporter n=1 Tax=Carnobacterium jeotgali TaxID=545534 RepID=UPI003C78B107